MLENQGLNFFTQNPVFQLIFYLKHRINRDKTIYGLKKSPQKSKSTLAQICFFMNFKDKKT
jgi:hypothetical protein